MKWGYISASKLETERVRSFYLCWFLCKQRPLTVSLEYPALENIPKVPRNRAKIGQNNDVRKTVAASLSLLKWSGATFWLKTSKGGVGSFFLCPFLCKPRPSAVCLESPRLENIPQVPAHRAKVCQNHDARKAVSATLSVFKSSWALFSLKSSKASVR